MRVPIFLSCPTTLSSEQEGKRKVILKLLDELQLEARSLGRSDYPKDYPLKEVYVIAKNCAGGVILGFEQYVINDCINKRGTPDEKTIKDINFPTPWNQLEAGILFGLKLPLLVFREDKVVGGIFDVGISDIFINTMPPINPNKKKIDELKQLFLKWHGEVRRRYYEF